MQLQQVLRVRPICTCTITELVVTDGLLHSSMRAIAS